MVYLFLLTIKNLMEDKVDKVGVLFNKKYKDVINVFNIGKETNFFSSRSLVLGKLTMEVDEYLYDDIRKSIRESSMISVHFFRGSYFLSVDNKVWLLKTGESSDKLIEYKKVYLK